jgi:hypothetical protein
VNVSYSRNNLVIEHLKKCGSRLRIHWSHESYPSFRIMVDGLVHNFLSANVNWKDVMGFGNGGMS